MLFFLCPVNQVPCGSSHSLESENPGRCPPSPHPKEGSPSCGQLPPSPQLTGISFWGDKNISKRVVLVAQLCEDTDWAVHLDR